MAETVLSLNDYIILSTYGPMSFNGLPSLGSIRRFINEMVVSLRDIFMSSILAATQDQQKSLMGAICRGLLSALYFLQAIIVLGFASFLTVQDLFFAKSQYPHKWYPPLVTSAVVSGAFALIWQACFIWKIKATVKSTLWFTPVLTLIVGVFLLVEGSALVLGVLTVIAGFLQAAYGTYVIPAKLAYTCKILSICSLQRPARTPATVAVSVLCCIFYCIFLVGGIGGGITILYKSLIVISMVWTMEVFKNIIAVATAKTTYMLYTMDDEPVHVLRISLIKQIGNICVGSLLVPVIVLIRGIIRTCNKADNVSDPDMYSNTSDRRCNRIVNNLILWGNKWAYVHVAVSIQNFFTSSSDSWNAFRRVPGLEELIDSELTSSICFLSAIAVGAVSALISGMWVFITHRDYTFELTVYAFIIGYFMETVASAWLQGSVMGYYVAFSEDPQRNKFDETIRTQILQQEEEKRI